jgi:hypothetical protein
MNVALNNRGPENDGYSASATRPSVWRASALAGSQAQVEDTANRTSANELLPKVQRLADELEVPTRMIEKMPAFSGGAEFTRDILSAPLKPKEGLGLIGTQTVLDTIDQCIGAAKELVASQPPGHHGVVRARVPGCGDLDRR